MKVGAEALVRQWGRDMTFWRDGVEMFGFKGRLVETRPTEDQFDYSVDQHNFRIIGCFSDFVFGSPVQPVVPRKFDVIQYRGESYTVQRSHIAGADEDELIKMEVRGGVV